MVRDKRAPIAQDARNHVRLKVKILTEAGFVNQEDIDYSMTGKKAEQSSRMGER